MDCEEHNRNLRDPSSIINYRRRQPSEVQSMRKFDKLKLVIWTATFFIISFVVSPIAHIPSFYAITSATIISWAVIIVVNLTLGKRLREWSEREDY